jgi:transcriptional regulator GlxA family with amidase domain
MRRSGSDPQFSPWVMHRNHIHPAVHRTQDAVLKNPADEWTAARLADVACTSERNLARLFAEHAGCSPLDYVQRIRVALARELLANSSLDVERVAERAGFSSAHQLRRVWRRWEAQSPAAHRRRPDSGTAKS